MKEVRTEINIDATPDKVWNVLTNFKDYPSWNPFVKWLDGDVNVNEKIEVRIAPPDASGMTFKPSVLSYDKNKGFRWIGHLLFPGLFDGEHIFELTDNGNGTTTFVQREQFSGVLVPLLKNMLNKTQRGFELMNSALKERVEKHVLVFQANKKGRHLASLYI